MIESKKIIILGACGNIGKQMVDYFLERLDDGYELIGTDVIHDEYIESRIPLIDDLGELADTGRFDQQIAHAHLFDLFESFFKVALQRAADTAVVDLFDFQ